jgi:hypothetical protein
MQTTEQGRTGAHHYLWRDMGESLEEVRERFHRMIE